MAVREVGYDIVEDENRKLEPSYRQKIARWISMSSGLHIGDVVSVRNVPEKLSTDFRVDISKFLGDDFITFLDKDKYEGVYSVSARRIR